MKGIEGHGPSNADHWARFWDRHTIVHTHIPKTAGSTLTRALFDLAGEAVLDMRDVGRSLREVKDELRAGLRVLAGHVFHAAHRHLPKVPLYIASVRDPVEREVSRYRFLQTQPDHPAHAAVAGKPFGAAWQALREFRGAEKTRNRQCQRLTGFLDPDKLRKPLVRQRLTERYLLVIPSDRMSETIAALYAAFGRAAPDDRRENVSTAPLVAVDPDLADQIRETNAMDDWMVREAARVFPQRLAAAIDYLADPESGAIASPETKLVNNATPREWMT